MPHSHPSTSPLRRPGFPLWTAFCLALACALAAPSLRAAAPTISAAFLPNPTSVGEAVQLRVEIKGTSHGGHVPEIHVDGLDIQYIGPSSQEMINFENGTMNRTSTIIQLYQVIPRRAGSFTLPALGFEADGQMLRTEPIVLNVQNAGSGGNGDGGLDTAGRAEIVLGKKSVYVGEAISADLRFYIDARIGIDPENMPNLEGDGFTKEKFQQPHEERIHRDGRDYRVVVFHTTVTPSRAGTISIGPSGLQYIAQIPRLGPNHPRSAFGGDSLLEQVFGDRMRSFTRERKQLEAEPVNLEVKPLPPAGRPADFSGAVGQFKMTVDGSPKKVKLGDPVTVKLTVTGSGSLNRIGAPSLPDSTGWRTYPPSSRTMADDASGMKGSRIFEQAVIPTEKQSHLPIYEFSYFDPKLEKYLTLKSDPIPINVEGEPLPTPPPVGKTADQPSGSPQAPAPLPAPTDITGIRYEFGAARSVDPLYLRLGFLLAQLAPALGLGGLVAARYWRPNPEGRRLSSLRRERASLQARLRRESSKSAFYAAAVRVFQIQGAIATGRPPETIDAAAVRRLCSGHGSTALDEVFETQAQSLYAGAAGGEESLSPAERARVLGAISELEKSKALS